MQVLALSKSPVKAARWAMDTHVNKLATEGAQVLCAALDSIGVDYPYRLSHQHHPLCVWASKSFGNYRWLWKHVMALCKEHTYRTGKIHQVERVLRSGSIPLTGVSKKFKRQALTGMCNATGMEVKSSVISTYREFYQTRKRHLAVWTRRAPPPWYAPPKMSIIRHDYRGARPLGHLRITEDAGDQFASAKALCKAADVMLYITDNLRGINQDALITWKGPKVRMVSSRSTSSKLMIEEVMGEIKGMSKINLLLIGNPPPNKLAKLLKAIHKTIGIKQVLCGIEQTDVVIAHTAQRLRIPCRAHGPAGYEYYSPKKGDRVQQSRKKCRERLTYVAPAVP